jgi:hypothetical protein
MDITDVSEVLVIHRTGSNTYPDCGRKRRQGSRGILNAFEINYVDEDKQINCCPFLAHSCNPS